MYPWEYQSPWSKDYVDVDQLVISDEDYDHLLIDHPEMPRSWDDDCPTCRGRKKFFWEGEYVPCDCRHQVTLHKHYLNANIGLLYQQLAWSDFQGDEVARTRVESFLDLHATHVHNGLGYMLFGDSGTGKTMLITLAGKEFVKLGYSVFFITFPQMIAMFTAGWKSDDERRRFERRVVHSDVLLIDDVGKEWSTNDIPKATIDDVIRRRVASKRSTWLTTNMDQGSIEMRYGGASISSLLREACIPFDVEGGDFRTEAVERNFEWSEKGWVRPIS